MRQDEDDVRTVQYMVPAIPLINKIRKSEDFSGIISMYGTVEYHINCRFNLLFNDSVADPDSGSGAFLTLGSGIRDGKSLDPH